MCVINWRSKYVKTKYFMKSLLLNDQNTIFNFASNLTNLHEPRGGMTDSEGSNVGLFYFKEPYKVCRIECRENDKEKKPQGQIHAQIQ